MSNLEGSPFNRFDLTLFQGQIGREVPRPRPLRRGQQSDNADVPREEEHRGDVPRSLQAVRGGEVLRHLRTGTRAGAHSSRPGSGPRTTHLGYGMIYRMSEIHVLFKHLSYIQSYKDSHRKNEKI